MTGDRVLPVLMSCLLNPALMNVRVMLCTTTLYIPVVTFTQDHAPSSKSLAKQPIKNSCPACCARAAWK